MSANKYRKHLVILPEDQAYATMARGFKNYYRIRAENLEIKKVCGGWKKVFEMLASTYVPLMEQNPDMHVLCMIDFDYHRKSRQNILTQYEANLLQRIYLLGCRQEAEDFKRDMKHGKLEAFGTLLAEACVNSDITSGSNPWLSDQLKENGHEIEKIRHNLGMIIFRSK